MKTKNRRFTWVDEYALELRHKSASELFEMAICYEGQALPSERTMEIAIMVRAEINRRFANLEAAA